MLATPTANLPSSSHRSFPFWNQATASINPAALVVLTEAILNARTGVIVRSAG